MSCKSILGQPSTNSSVHRIILLEDLPNILHHETQSRFHQALASLVNSPPSDCLVPVVIIISDAGTRGEDLDQRLMDGHGFGTDKSQVIDVRTVVPKELLRSVFVTEIRYYSQSTLLLMVITLELLRFNPIAPTLLRKALQLLLNKHFDSHMGTVALSPSKEVLDEIVESSNGDIRSAIMALQFACIVEIPGSKQKGVGKKGATVVMEAVTRREQSLQLFHLLGKVLYNKREPLLRGDCSHSSKI